MTRIAKPSIASKLEPGEVSQISDEATLELVYFGDFESQNLHATNLGVDEVRWERAQLPSAKLDKIAANDMVADRCDLSAVRCAEGSFQRTEFLRTRLTGWDISNGVLKDVLFSECKIDMANLRFAKLRNVKFTDCQLQGADFINATLTHVQFLNCDLGGVTFAQCAMKDVDLRTSNLDIAGWQYLKGATIDGAQLMLAAPQLAQEFGLLVEEI